MADFYRYSLKASLGVVTSPGCNVLYDGEEKLAIVGALEEIKVWNLRTGTLKTTLVDTSDSSHYQVTVLSANPSNKDVIAAGYEDGSIRLWSLKESRLLVQFNGHKSTVTVLAFDPYTMRMASGGRDSDIVIWDLVGESGLFRLQGHTGGISALQFICSGQYLLSAARDSLLKVWDLEAQMAIETEVSHRNEISDFVTSHDEQVLMTVGADQLLRVFYVDLKTLPLLLKSSEAKVTAISHIGDVQRGTKERALQLLLHPNNRTLCILSADKTVELFDVRGRDEAKQKLRRKKKSVGSEEIELAVTDLFKPLRLYRSTSRAHSFVLGKDVKDDSVKVLLAHNNNRLEELMVPFDQQKTVTTLSTIEALGHRGEIKAVAISSDQALIVSGGADGVKVWSSVECQYLRSLHADEVSDVLSVVFLRNSQHCLIGTKKGLLILGDANSGELIEAYQAHGGSIVSIDVGADGRTIATASSDKTVKLWEFRESKLKLKCLKTLELGEEAFVARMSKDMRLLAVATLDLTVKVFFLDTLKIYLNLYGHKLPVVSIDISEDSKTLITGSLDKSIKLWGLEFGEMKKSLLAHTEAVTQVKFISNTMYASVGKDRAVKTWNSTAALQRHFERCHFGEIWTLACSADLIVTAGHDRSIKVFELSNDLLIPEEEAEKEADQRLEKSVIESNESSNTHEASKLTIDSMKAGERILTAIEAADEERMAIDEARLSGRSQHSPTIFFASVARNLQPYEYVMKQLDAIAAPDLDQAILLLPQRLLYSLFLYIESAIDSPYLSVAAAVFNVCMRSFFNEIVADRGLKGSLVSIKSKLRDRLQCLDQLLVFNYAAMNRIQSL